MLGFEFFNDKLPEVNSSYPAIFNIFIPFLVIAIIRCVKVQYVITKQNKFCDTFIHHAFNDISLQEHDIIIKQVVPFAKVVRRIARDHKTGLRQFGDDGWREIEETARQKRMVGEAGAIVRRNQFGGVAVGLPLPLLGIALAGEKFLSFGDAGREVWQDDMPVCPNGEQCGGSLILQNWQFSGRSGLSSRSLTSNSRLLRAGFRSTS